MIKHEEMKIEIDKIYNKPFNILKLDNAPLSAVPQFANFAKKVYQYITEQEKKDELLGLYKKLVRAEAKRVRTLEYYKRYSWGLQDYKNARKTAKEIQQRIKQLEEELK